MADIRINALATTATTPASDDYLALDGAAQGTRKILATNIANNVTDVILGTSGPSVKSSLSARAPRQGLVFDGTAGAAVSVPAFGTSDFSVAAVINPANLAALRWIVSGPSNSFGLLITTTGTILAAQVAGTSNTASTGTVTAGTNALIAYVRSNGVGTYYINGVSAGTTTDTNNYSVGFTYVSWPSSTFVGTIAPLVYNRALSASEVVSLYEAGAPAGADYNSPAATNTSIVTSAFVNSGYSTFSGAAATGFTAAAASGSNYATSGNASNTLTIKKGSLFKLTFTATLTSGAAPTVALRGITQEIGTTTVVAGSNSLVMTMPEAGASDALGFVIFRSTGATSYAISSFSLTPLGLLLAPDAAQAGGGLVWYDTSGNAANITLPASGVSWNVPSSRVLGGNWTTSGNLTVSGTGTSSFGGQISIAGGAGSSAPVLVDYYGAFQAPGGVFVNTSGTRESGFTSNGNDIRVRTGNLDGRAVFASNGNFLIGTTTDSANGKLQLATHTTSAGGIGFGTATSLYTQSAGNLALDHIGGTNPVLNFRENAVAKAYVGTSGSILYVGTNTANSVVLQTNATTALTLDSSQNATFAGKVTVSGTADSIFGLGGTGNNTQTLLINGSSANTYGPAIHLRRNGTTTGFLASESATNTNNLNNLVLWGGLGNDVKIFTNNGTLAATYSGANATFAGQVTITPEAGLDSYIGYSTNRDTFLTCKAAGSHYLRDATGTVWWQFDRNKTFIVNTTSAPGSNPSGGGYLYVEGGALKYRGSSGTVTTIANA